MQRAFLCSLVFAALAACGPSPSQTKAPEPPQALEPFDLNIEIGRYGAMLSTVESLAEQRSETDTFEVTEPRDMTRRLREHAWEYNLVRSKLCARNIQAQVSCGPAFNPVWLADPAEAEVGLEEIKARNEALGEEVMRLWGAVCDEARAGVADEQEKMAVCPME